MHSIVHAGDECPECAGDHDPVVHGDEGVNGPLPPLRHGHAGDVLPDDDGGARVRWGHGGADVHVSRLPESWSLQGAYRMRLLLADPDIP